MTKQKQPNSATVLNNWIARAEQDLGIDQGGRLGWLVASTILTAALQPTSHLTARVDSCSRARDA